VNVADYWAVFFDLNEAIKKRIEAEGLTIPFPQRDVHIYNEK
jgi:small conductance mechanosensitive channel